MNKERSILIEKVAHIEVYDFDEVKHELFAYQVKYNKLFADFNQNFSNKSANIYLPISAFKSHKIWTGNAEPTLFFESSGTTSSINSRHYLKNTEHYLSNCRKGFAFHYGDVNSYCILALLPHYSERQHSSLVAMVSDLVNASQYSESGFYLYNHLNLYNQLLHCQKHNIPTILFGVSFALLDFAEAYHIDFPTLTIMETGGMKGRRKEITRQELHDQLCSSFGTNYVHSEYGMTELLSQSYSKGDGLFYPSPTMKVEVTEISDPLSKEKYGKTGLINITDLANIDSCAFIATEDLGIAYEDGGFRVEGRLDYSDIRGCNLMVGDV